VRIRLVLLGKTRREEVRALLDDYVGRIKRYAETEVIVLRDAGPATLRKLRIDAAATVVLLDAAGKQHTSAAIRALAGRSARSRHARADFLCGNAKGFPDEIRAKAEQKSRSHLSPCRTNSRA